MKQTEQKPSENVCLLYLFSLRFCLQCSGTVIIGGFFYWDSPPPLNLLPGQVLLGRRLHSGCAPSSYGVPDNTSFRALLGLDPAEPFSPCPLAFLVVVGWDTGDQGLEDSVACRLIY